MDTFGELLFEDEASRDDILRAAFRRDPLLRGRVPLPRAPRADILYTEDFDAPGTEPDPPPALEPEQISPPITEATLEAARAEAYEQGYAAATREHAETEAQLRRATAQTLADAFAAWQTRAAEAVASEASELAEAIFALLHAAIPATMARHGAAEVEYLARTLLPLLRHERRLRIRAHASHLPRLQALAAELWPARALAPLPEILWDSDPACPQGDLEIEWEDGTARRDTTEIWAAIRAACGDLDLPQPSEASHAE